MMTDKEVNKYLDKAKEMGLADLKSSDVILLCSLLTVIIKESKEKYEKRQRE
jgi:hypothetical protein